MHEMGIAMEIVDIATASIPADMQALDARIEVREASLDALELVGVVVALVVSSS